MQPYYVASLKGQGWFSKTSQFNTDLKQAKEMYYEEAIAMCKRFKSAGHICVPVQKRDVEAIG